MNIILLSGGSGQRLWPLSNSIRSKQFLRLFKDSDGNSESMVQRVYRQIIDTDPNATIIITTNKKQVSMIHNQLGNKIDICVEPCRRDTFPALILSAAFLYYEKGISLNQAIVVCPVDTFVEKKYYETLKEIVTLAEEGTSNIILMGIEPNHPSEKYGYIIPKTVEKVSKVIKFKEKPSITVAENYIKEGALWNAGVFAFKLNYLIKKAHDMIDFSDYEDLLIKYNTLKKISFDYAVIENETDMQVIRYAGDWKDIGTWNEMTEAMDDNIKGDVICDNTCLNTEVINELNIPLLCMGCKDMIIAASNSGILISNKERSSYIKPYIENMSHFVKETENLGKSYTVIDSHSNSIIAKLLLNKGIYKNYLSYEKIMWIIVSGFGKILINKKEKNFYPGTIIRMIPEYKYTLIADTDLDIIEIQIKDIHYRDSK